MASLLLHFDRNQKPSLSEVSKNSFVHPTASIGKNVVIEPFVSVGESAKIGDGSWIQSGAVIEKGAVVGQSSRIAAHAVVGADCVIGSNCQIGSGTVIGSDGFGFVENGAQPPIKVPQIGNAVLEDHVEFGANCAVDRATIGSTRIGAGSKFDNFCHIAHNCRIGKNGLFAGGFFIAGSSVIGDNFMCGGNVAIADHIQITDRVLLGGRATVTKDITEAGAYTGYPLEKLKDGLRTLASLPYLSDLRFRITALEEKIK